MLVLALGHLLHTQARPAGDSLAGLHARGACCCSKEAGAPAAIHARVQLGAAEAEDCCAGPASPPARTDTHSGHGASTTGGQGFTQASDDDAGCCGKTGSSCACHHYGPVVSGVFTPRGAVVLPSPSSTRLALIADRLCHHNLAPPEQPPRA